MTRPAWRMAAASVRGTSHERLGTVCQDANSWALTREGILLVAVADGAGTAGLAERGAKIATASSIGWLQAKLAGAGSTDHPAAEESCNLLAAAAQCALDALKTAAQKTEVPVTEFATTLTLAVASMDGLAVFQVGDGAVVWVDAEGAFHAPPRVAGGEYLNETVFLTSADALNSGLRVAWNGDLKHLALLSDGLQMAALRMPDAQPHPGFFNPLFQFIASEADSSRANGALVEFLTSPKLRLRCDDDVTLVLATRVEI